MNRYNAFRLIREGLTGQKGWEPAWHSPAEPKPSYDAIVIGGGGHGLATAYYLAKEHGMTNTMPAATRRSSAPTTSMMRVRRSTITPSICGRAWAANSTSTS
jgi:hypothetical protein